jgi:hypothetical protein
MTGFCAWTTAADPAEGGSMEAMENPWIEDLTEVPYLFLPVVTDMESLARDLPAGSYACWLHQGDNRATAPEPA